MFKNISFPDVNNSYNLFASIFPRRQHSNYKHRNSTPDIPPLLAVLRYSIIKLDTTCMLFILYVYFIMSLTKVFYRLYAARFLFLYVASVRVHFYGIDRPVGTILIPERSIRLLHCIF